MKQIVINTPSDTQIEVIRSFDSEVSSVWKCFTDANLVCKWMQGPVGWSMPICEIDFRVGGKYMNVFRNEVDGLEISIVGNFREIKTYSKIIQDEKHLIGNLAISKNGLICREIVILYYIFIQLIRKRLCLKLSILVHYY